MIFIDTPKDSLSQAEWAEPSTIWNPMFFGIFFANMVMNLSQEMSNSQLSLYARSIGTSADQIGVLMSMFAVTALIFRFISGPAMNAFNRKKLYIMAMSLFTLASVGFALSPVLSERSTIPVVSILKGFRLLQGVGNAFGNACAMTIVADALPKNSFATGMGYYACAQVVAQAIGPTVGVMLSKAFGFETTFFIVAAIMMCAILATLTVRPAPRQVQRFNLRFNNVVAPEAVLPALIVFFVAMGFTSINAFLLVYAEERGIKGSSLFFTVFALSMLITRPVVGKLSDKYGFVKVGVPSAIASAASLVLIGFSSALPSLLLAAVVNACGYGAIQPAIQSLCLKAVSPERRGSASGTYFICLDSATILGPMLCGYVASTAGYTSKMWIAMSVPCLASIVVMLGAGKRISGIEAGFESK